MAQKRPVELPADILIIAAILPLYKLIFQQSSGQALRLSSSFRLFRLRIV
jgi:hypothetical protein